MKLSLCFAASVVGLVAVIGSEQTVLAQPPFESQPAIEFQSNGLPIGVPETTGGIHGEPMLRFGTQHPWMHGYIQEIPPYSGYAAFRPYNYKHVLSQAQVAGGWGMSPKMPYAQQYWHKYRHRVMIMPTYSGRRSSTAQQESPRMSRSNSGNGR